MTGWSSVLKGYIGELEFANRSFFIKFLFYAIFKPADYRSLLHWTLLLPLKGPDIFDICKKLRH